MAALVAIRRKQHETHQHSVTASFIQSREIAHFLTQEDDDKEELKKAAWTMQEQNNDKNCIYRKELRELYEHRHSQMAVAGVIVLNFVCEALGAQMQPKENSETYHAFLGLEYFFTIFFSIELCWNMYGTWFYLFWTGPSWGWNLFDFIVVVISFLALIFPNLPGITVLRLFRAFRVARLFKRIPSLRKIIEGVLKAIPGLLQMGSVLLIFLGIWSVIGVQFYSDIAQKEFGTFSWAMYTMAKAMLGEFVLTSDKLMYTYNRPEAAIFFYSFIFIVGIVMMNVVVAILLENYLNYQEDGGPTDGPVSGGNSKPVFEKGYPTLYVRKDGILEPIRSLSYEQLEEILELCRTFSPPDSEVREYSKFSDEPVESWTVANVVQWLESIDYQDFAQKFTNGQVNGRCLMMMSTFDMHQLGMKFGRQMQFSLELQKLVAHQSKRVKKIEAMREAFDRYDLDGSGYLDRDEFKIAWRMIYNKQNGILAMTRKISDNISTIRTNTSRGKDDDELEQDLDAIFDMLDIYNDDQISWEEFRKGSDLLGMRSGVRESIRQKRMSSGYFAGAKIKPTAGEAARNSNTNQMIGRDVALANIDEGVELQMGSFFNTNMGSFSANSENVIE